jgi:hypothetical protein
MSNGFATRLCAAGGAVYVILGLATTSGSSNEPTLRSSRAEIASWTTQQHLTHGRIVLGVLTAIALMAVIPFAAGLWHTLRKAEGESGVLSTTMLAAAAVWIAVKFASAMPEFALHWRAQGMSAQLAASLHDMGDFAFSLTFIPQALMLGCAATVILRSGVLPRFLGWFAAIVAVGLIVTLPISNLVPPVAVLLAMLWVLLTSIVLVRRGDRVPGVAPAYSVAAS